MKYPYGPRSMLIGYFIGFIAGVYSILYTHIEPRIVTTWQGLILGIIWYLLIGLMTLCNAWGMLHQAEILDYPQKHKEES